MNPRWERVEWFTSGNEGGEKNDAVVPQLQNGVNSGGVDGGNWKARNEWDVRRIGESIYQWQNSGTSEIHLDHLERNFCWMILRTWMTSKGNSIRLNMNLLIQRFFFIVNILQAKEQMQYMLIGTIARLLSTLITIKCAEILFCRKDQRKNHFRQSSHNWILFLDKVSFEDNRYENNSRRSANTDPRRSTSSRLGIVSPVESIGSTTNKFLWWSKIPVHRRLRLRRFVSVRVRGAKSTDRPSSTGNFPHNQRNTDQRRTFPTILGPIGMPMEEKMRCEILRRKCRRRSFRTER